MRSYDPPPETDDLTAKQAQAAVHKMHADVLADKEHPLLSGSHPQHGDFVKFSTQLHRIIIEAEADQQDALQAEKLEDARAEVGDLTSQQCLDRGKMLLATPGYLDGSMPQAERAKLKKEIDACYLVGSQPETSTPDETENDNEPGNLEE